MEPLAVLNAVRAERATLQRVNPNASFQIAYRASGRPAAQKTKSSGSGTVPVVATVHGLTLPTALTIEAAISPSRIEKAEVKARRPIARLTAGAAAVPREPARVENVVVPAASVAGQVAANPSNIALFVDLERLAVSGESRRAPRAGDDQNAVVGYTRIELGAIAKKLGLVASGTKAQVLDRIVSATRGGAAAK